ncbi:MAG: hypothetical protein LBD32_01530 [Cytophagales bacterium]|nr:hypothetical protein [Cytophagales bacterium]
MSYIVLGKNPELTPRITDAFYQVYSEVFANRTGVVIDFKQMCESDGVEITTDYGNFKILNGVVITALEYYFLREKSTTKNEVATLKKIFSGAGDAALVRKRPAYVLALDALTKNIEAMVEIIAQYAAPFCRVDRLKLVNLIKVNNTIKVSDVKWMNEHTKDLVNFSKIFTEEAGAKVLHIRADNGWFTKKRRHDKSGALGSAKN